MPTPVDKSRRTARWATTMTKWLATFTSSGVAWNLVEFAGPAGSESRGIVDLLAVRKDHRTVVAGLKRGDLFEVVLVQVKGGGARWPTRSDVDRLRAVARHHRARAVVLAEWKKGAAPRLYRLRRVLRSEWPARDCWEAVDPSDVFG